MKYVKVKIGNNVFRAILVDKVDTYTKYRTIKKKTPSGVKEIKTLSTERKIQIYINRELVNDYYIVIPLSKDKLRKIDEVTYEVV